VQAKENETRFGTLFSSIRAIMFFGTPHRGLVVDDILAMIKENSPRQALVQSLQQGENELQRQLRRFINYSTLLNLKIVSFKEIEQTQKLIQVCEQSL
jgi:hypothetical protein